MEGLLARDHYTISLAMYDSAGVNDEVPAAMRSWLTAGCKRHAEASPGQVTE